MTQLSYLSTDSVKTRTALRWIQAENAWLKLTFSQFMRGPCKESTCVKTVTYYHTNYSRSHLSWSSQPTKNCVNSSKKFHINSTCIWKKIYGLVLRCSLEDRVNTHKKLDIDCGKSHSLLWLPEWLTDLTNLWPKQAFSHHSIGCWPLSKQSQMVYESIFYMTELKVKLI